MASWMDLRPDCERLDVGCTYIAQPAIWIQRLVAGAYDRPTVINVKNVPLAKSVILLSFEEYKRLVAAGGTE